MTTHIKKLKETNQIISPGEVLQKQHCVLAEVSTSKKI